LRKLTCAESVNSKVMKVFALSSLFTVVSAADSPLGKDIFDATVGLMVDLVEYTTASPRFISGLVTTAIGVVRDLPGLAKNVFEGDAATQDKMVGFAVSCASTVFALYIGLAAFNLALHMACQTKNHFKKFLDLPFSGFLPRDLVQEHCLDRIKGWQVKNFFMPFDPLDGKSKVSLALIGETTATAITTCMLLSCAPAVLGMVRGGADAKAAQALAWTFGTAVGLQYLMKLAA